MGPKMLIHSRLRGDMRCGGMGMRRDSDFRRDWPALAGRAGNEGAECEIQGRRVCQEMVLGGGKGREEVRTSCRMDGGEGGVCQYSD